MKSQVKNLELGQEYPPTDEADAIQNIIKIHVESFLKRNTQPVQRTEHPKHHGCVRAEFTIAADVPEPLKGSGLDVLLNSIEGGPSSTSSSSSNISETPPL